MGQLRTGTVDLTNNSATVVVNGVASGAEEVAVGSAFKRDNEAAIYTVASRTPASGGSLTQITLTAPYAGTTGAGVLYQITTDFSPGRNYPLLSQGDGDAADWITLALTKIDTDISSLIAAFPVAPGAAGGVAYATGSALAWTGAGSAGHVLISGGAGAPSWAANIAGKSGSTDALKSATTTVNVSAATAPTAGQVLTATGDSAATWQDPTGGVLDNAEHIEGKTSGGIAKRLIGVTATNYVHLDADGLAIIAGGSGGKQITSADGTLRANGTGVANNRVCYLNSNSEIIANANFVFDGTNLAIGWAGAGSYPLDLYSKGRADRWLLGTAGSPTIHASLTYAINGQAGILSAYGIQLKANTYVSADAALTNVGNYNAYHVIIPAQDGASIGLGIRAAVAQTGALFRAENSAGTALLDITASGALKFYGSTSGYIAFSAPAAAGAQNYVLPGADGTSGQVLTTNGSGTLSWATAGGGGSGTVNPGTAGRLAWYATTSNVVSETNAAVSWNNTSGRMEFYHALNTSTTSGIIDITCNNNSGLGLHVATPGTTAFQYAVRFRSTGGRDDLVVMANGRIGIGASYGASTFTELVNVKNNSFIGGINAAGNGNKQLIGLNASDQVVLSGGAADIRWGVPLVALGGGAAPTLGTIGGSGPATAAQDSWMRVIDSAGNAFWVPVWK